MTEERFQEIVAEALTGHREWVKAGSGRRFRIELGPEEWDPFVCKVRMEAVVDHGPGAFQAGPLKFMGLPWVKGTEPGVILRAV